MLGLVEDVLPAHEGAIIQHVQIVRIFVKSAKAHSDDVDATAPGHSFAGEKIRNGRPNPLPNRGHAKEARRRIYNLISSERTPGGP